MTLGNNDLDRAYPSDARLGAYASKALTQSSVRFVGETSRQRRMEFVARVLQRAGLEPERAAQEAPVLLGLVYDLLEQTAGRLQWLEAGTTWSRTGEQARGIRIRLGDLCLRRPPELFRSPRTGQVFSTHVLGCAPIPVATTWNRLRMKNSTGIPGLAVAVGSCSAKTTPHHGESAWPRQSTPPSAGGTRCEGSGPYLVLPAWRSGFPGV